MDLESGRPWWFQLHGICSVAPPLGEDIRCDVAVIGSGITGALAAWTLASAGASVVVLDRRDLAQGSTMASTALLQYDLDVPLHRLAESIGRDRAERAFVLGAQTIGSLIRTARRVGTEIQQRPSLYFTRRRTSLPALEKEHRARAAAGLNVEWCDHDGLLSRWGVRARGAIVSSQAAQCDPYLFAHRLLSAAASRGARIFDRTDVLAASETSRHVRLRTSRRAVVRADAVVDARGYEAANSLPPDARAKLSLRSTFALATEPLPKQPAHPCLLWEYADPYLYARWAGDRLLLGGGDESFSNAPRRDRLIPAKTRALLREFSALLPGLRMEPAFSWAGTFATTSDGMGFIGVPPGSRRRFFALGFGGNGITCSAIAARIIADELAGRHNPDARLFAFDR